MRNTVSMKGDAQATDVSSMRIKKHTSQQGQMVLYNRHGRLYLNASERQRFEQVANQLSQAEQSLCLMLLYTGCRLSEALAMKPESIQLAEGVVSIQCLKKRDKFVVREVPVPNVVLSALPTCLPSSRFWPISRSTAWRTIKRTMREAGISGQHASPKGLRHGFGCHAVMNGIPLPVLQKWLGHSDIRTTAIYTSICGREEMTLAQRMWAHLPARANDEVYGIHA